MPRASRKTAAPPADEDETPIIALPETNTPAGTEASLPQRILPHPWPFLLSVVVLRGKPALVMNASVAEVVAKKAPTKKTRVARKTSPEADEAPL